MAVYTVVARSDSDDAIQIAPCGGPDCFAEPVIGRAMCDPLARNDVARAGVSLTRHNGWIGLWWPLLYRGNG
jgi:hypothetical protein